VSIRASALLCYDEYSIAHSASRVKPKSPANARAATLQAQLDALPGAEQREVTLREVREQSGEIWTLPPRQVARLLQRAGLRVWVTDGQVVRVGFV